MEPLAPGSKSLDPESKPLVAESITASLSVEQKVAIALALEGKNVFVTGGGGTGKSHLIAALKTLKHRLLLTATTGIAAVNIGGRTIHSASGLGIGTQNDFEMLKLIGAKWVKKKWEPYECVLIDEISMLHPSFFEKLDFLLRGLFISSRPFGGKQVIVIGDFAQLPPVSKTNVDQLEYLKPLDAIRFCFQTKAWEDAKFHTVLLTTVFRQRDRLFADVLNRCRFGRMTDQDFEVLRSRVGVNVAQNGIEPTHLYAINAQVAEINARRLEELPGALELYKGVSTQSHSTIDCDRAMADLVKSVPVAAELGLKVGAQVMLVANLSVEMKLCNGSRGVVEAFMTEEELAEASQRIQGPPESSQQPQRSQESPAKRARLAPKYPLVKFANGLKVLMKPWTWSTRVNKTESVKYVQVPLALAWATTVHKSQGQSLDNVLVDLSRVFEEGQAYVALSRVRTIEGLSIIGLDASVFRTNGAVAEFYAKLGQE